MVSSLESYAQQVVQFVRLHEAWAPPIVFVLAFAESLALLSLLVPAWAALVGIGALCLCLGRRAAHDGKCGFQAAQPFALAVRAFGGAARVRAAVTMPYFRPSIIAASSRSRSER